MLHSSSTILDACGLIGLSVAVAAYGTFVPQSNLWGHVVSHGTRDQQRRIALTFDDGPTPGATNRALDLLGEMQVKATFFVIGQNAERSPELLQRIDAEGHQIGNHTFDHSHWAMWGGKCYWQSQLERTDTVIGRIIGRRPATFRPPVGIKTWYTLGAAREKRKAVIGWSVRGFDGFTTAPQRILDRVLPRAQSGDIILLHDGIEPNHHRDPSATLAAIKPLVSGLRQRGLTPVRLDELSSLPAYVDRSAP